uniref:KANL2-like probable zinc-finger domain-containing protein n=1 Tax=Cavia porcellus TaxID=10141 RepID=H0VI45_CAVPO
VDTMAFSLAVPTLALKMPNGLDGMSLSPPGARVPLHYLDTDLEDPFAFHEEDEDLKKGATVKKKLQSKLAQNRQRQRETEILKVRQEHFSPPPTPSQQLQPQLSPPPPGSICTSPPPPLIGGPAQGAVPPNAAAQARPGPHRRPPPAPSRPDRVLMQATAFSPHLSCISRLQRLVTLYTQRHQLDADLFPHLGLDWSEESGEELEDTEQASPYQAAWSLREALRHERHTSDDEDDMASRSSRVTQLCTYFQQKYKHLCRLARAESRQKRCRLALRSALLQAASREPESAGQLLQELRRAACGRTSRTKLKEFEPAACSGTVKGEQCPNRALPFTRHCFQHILLSRSQQLFSSCTARFADGQQCAVPVFDITHQTPLCEEHAKKMDDFLRGDSSRKVQHQQPRKPRKKTKPPALT